MDDFASSSHWPCYASQESNSTKSYLHFVCHGFQFWHLRVLLCWYSIICCLIHINIFYPFSIHLERKKKQLEWRFILSVKKKKNGSSFKQPYYPWMSCTFEYRPWLRSRLFWDLKIPKRLCMCGWLSTMFCYLKYNNDLADIDSSLNLTLLNEHHSSE